MPDGSRSFSASSPDLDRVAVLFRAHFGFVRRVLRRCGVAEADLDDAVQDVFLVVHRRIDDFEGRASETTWLYAVAVRVASTLRRSASRELARRDKAGAQMHSASEADPERELSRQEAAEVLDSLLSELDGTKRTVFVLAELEGVPVPEIAQIMDANLRTTHSRLRLARKRFNAALVRHHAREAGRMQRVSLRSLTTRTEAPAPEPSRARAAWAALAVRISEGASPPAIAWTGAAASAGKAFWLPFAVTVGLGVAGVGTVATLTAPSPAPPQIVEHEPSPSPPPSAASVPAPTPVPVVASPSVEAPPQPEPAPPPAPKQRRTRSKPQPDAPVTTSASSLEAETALLERARSLLRAGKPDAALRVLDEHAAAHPSGLLASERLTTKVKALCSAGKVEQARATAGTKPRLMAVVEAACGTAE